MPKSSITVGSYVIGHIGFENDHIAGSGGPDHPCLIFRFDMDLRAVPSPMDENETVSPITILALSAEIIDNSNKTIASARNDLDIYVSERSFPLTTQVHLKVEIDQFKLRTIEKARVGDFQGNLILILLLATHSSTGAVNGFRLARVEPFKFSISKSRWIENLLPALGYGQLEIIEVSIPSSVQRKGLPKAVSELRSAQKYMTDGDWDKVAEHCRNSIQAIIDSKKVKVKTDQRGFKHKVDAFLDQHLKENIREKQVDLVRNQIKALWEITSIPHHSSQTNYFSRADAEFLVRNTVALVEYFGKLLE